MIARWRLIILALLFAAPWAVVIGLGFWKAWEQGWSLYVSLGIAACAGTAIALAWYWQAHNSLLKVEFDEPMYWTDRDKEAWKLVEARAQQINEINPDELMDMKFYADTAQDMALELAQFYHPNTKDPIDSLTVPEMLAVVELASHDLSEMVKKYIPGGHLVRVKDMKQAKQVADWIPTVTNAYYAISAIFAPYQTAVRYLANQAGVNTPMQMLQQNLLVWFYTAFVHRLGTYLIDVNSGRLRVGATRYRELVAKLQRDPANASTQMEAAKPTEVGSPAEAVSTPEDEHVKLTIVGQVSAGKSSLINALVKNQEAVTSALPGTTEITQYALNFEETDSSLVLFDTVGYGHEGPKEDQLKATQQAAQESDLILLVTKAKNAARAADVQLLTALKAWFEEHPNLKLPPILAIVSEIDQLKPAMEWEPPYNWQQPTKTKEQSIAFAVQSVQEQLAGYVSGVIPARLDEGNAYGVDEFLLPAITKVLQEGRAVAMLRVLHQEADDQKFQRILGQVYEGGKGLLKGLFTTISQRN
ncbi:MAG: GTPase family protein [Gemmataceae bacterium]